MITSDTLVSRISDGARSHPDAIAVRTEQATLSYAQLEICSNRLAQRLRAAGVAAESTVGVCAERSLELLVMLLAVWKAGGAYVPLDPAYPPERLRWMACDAGCALILTQTDAIYTGFDLGAEVIAVAPGGEGFEIYAPVAPAIDTSAADLAYVLYTSGSTGNPKGVMIEHGALLNHMYWMERRFPLKEGDRLLQKTSIGFDASIWELCAPLMAGAELVLARPGGHRDSAYLAHLLAAQRITVLQLVPSMLQALMEEDAFCANRSLLRVFCGGEALPTELVRSFRTSMSAELINLYGPTEAAIDASFWVCDERDGGATAPIGEPVANTVLHVLDDALQPVSPGCAGELFIAGAGLARGYRNLPEQTAERFVQHPHSGERMYRTGDRVRQLQSGALEFLGRLDHQVKLRGHRIELSEIETALAQQPGIDQAIVLMQAQRLIAFVTLAEAAPTIERALVSIRRRLPNYMIPDQVRVLDRLPLTINGKVDRRALQNEADGTVAVAPAPERLPRNATETNLAQLWCDLLGRDQVGVDEDFFRIGGNSLLATRLAARVRRQFLIELPLELIFERPRISALAAWIDDDAHSKVDAGIPRFARDRGAPLSFAQERVWFIHQIAPENMAYTFRTVTRLRGPLNRAALAETLTEIVRRHEIFRTSFPLVEGQPVQRVHAPWSVELPLLDVSPCGTLADAEAHRIIAADFRVGFDLAALPLIRWTLIKLSDQEHLLAQIEHHLIHDGWSFNIYLSEFKELYGAFAAGRPSPLPELALQFSDYAAWERDWIVTSGVAEKQLAYWRQALDGAPPFLDLDVTRARPAVASFRGGLHRVVVPPGLARLLRAVCQQEGVTLFMGMLAVFNVLLHEHSGRLDLVVGSGVANRRRLESESIMGMMLNTVVLRTPLHGDPSFCEILARVRRATLGAYANQDLPFERVVEAMSASRDLSCNPLAQVMFSFHDAPLPDMDIGKLHVEVTDLMENDSAKFDLSLIVIPRLERSIGTGASSRDESILAIWEFNTDLYERETVEQLAQEYLALIAELCARPQRRLSTIGAPESVVVALQRPGVLDAQVLQRTLNELAHRHGVLRGIDAQANVVVPVLHGEAGRYALQGLLETESRAPFPLVGAPLIRATLIQGTYGNWLLLTMHRLVAELFTPDALVAEFTAIYRCIESGDAMMPPFAGSIDHIHARDAAHRYWSERTRHWPEPLAMPADQPGHRTTSPSGAAEVLVLDMRLTEASIAFARRENVTLYDLLLTLFAVLLYRHSGQRALAIGNRIHANGDEAHGAPHGLMPDILALALTLDPAQSIVPLLREVRSALAEALRHRALSFAEVVAVAAAQGGAEQVHPLCTAMLSLERPAPANADEWTPMLAMPSHVGATAELDWQFAVRPNGMHIEARYDASRYDAATMRRMLERFSVLLEGVLLDGLATVGMVPILPAAERDLLVRSWNATDAARPVPSSVHELFRAQVRRDPQATALICGDQQLSYAELDTRADALAHYLLGHHIGPGRLVPLYCRRSIAMVVGMLAIIKTGAAYVPIDPGYPRDRIDYILKETEASLVLTEQTLLQGLPTEAVTPVLLDMPLPAAGVSAGPLPQRAGAGDLAYVIYTSGTTGCPKGVMVEHRNLIHFIRWFVHEYKLSPGQTSIVHSPLVFDLTVSTLWGPLVSGGIAHLMEEGDTEHLVTQFGQIRHAHLVKVTPAHLELLRSSLPESQLAELADTLIVAGEVFPTAAAVAWRRMAPRTRLVNFYGPTEITVGCSVHDITNELDESRSVPIGKPIENVQMYVLDAYLQPVPIGVHGEVYIGGEGVTRGYLKQPELTAERFLDDPFRSHGCLYRSGDLARMLADGSIEYLGRVDSQVKLRGFRVELGEIESVLATHPGVAEAAVVVDNSGSEKILVAWVVPSPGAVPAPQTLRDLAATKLPAYMVPVAFGIIDALPLNTNGKIDRAALAARMLPQVDAPASPPCTPSELQVSTIWSALLGHDRFGAEHDFFSVGGNSLMAVRMVARMRDDCDVQLPIRAVFDHPTVRSLSRHLDNLQWNKGRCHAATPVPREEFQL